MKINRRFAKKVNIITNILFVLGLIFFVLFIIIPVTGRLALVSEAALYLFIAAGVLGAMPKLYVGVIKILNEKDENQTAEIKKASDRNLKIFAVIFAVLLIGFPAFNLAKVGADLVNGTQTETLTDTSVTTVSSTGKYSRGKTYYIEGTQPSGKRIKLKISYSDCERLENAEAVTAEYYSCTKRVVSVSPCKASAGGISLGLNMPEIEMPL